MVTEGDGGRLDTGSARITYTRMKMVSMSMKRQLELDLPHSSSRPWPSLHYECQQLKETKIIVKMTKAGINIDKRIIN